MDVNIISVFYGLKLFVHYSRKTKRDLSSSPEDLDLFNPKVVITASCVGQYPFPIAPQYTASKHACVGLTRAVGEPLLRHENIAVNCIMPAFVATPIIPGRLSELWPKDYLTPLSTMCQAYDELVDVEGRVAQDGKSDGKDGEVKRGQSVECVVDRLYYRTHVPPADESQAFLLKESTEDGLWGVAIREALGAEAAKARFEGSG
jgi:NAD(P)-dependent dehydrogenase (short-subunit alcohol dehydrogenase family)